MMQFDRASITAFILTLGVAMVPQVTQAQVVSDSAELVSSKVLSAASPQRESSNSSKRRLSRVQQVVKATRSLIHRESLAATPSDRLDYALQLVASLNQLRRDPRLQRSRYLKIAEQQLVSRLKSIQSRTRAEHRRATRSKLADSDKRPKKIEIRQDVLAQLNAAAGVNAGVGNQPNANLGNQQQDYGPLLVDLIQRTISPSSWDVNGGLSSVQYFRPRHALVVRAPQSVHDDLGPVLHQLRKQ